MREAHGVRTGQRYCADVDFLTVTCMVDGRDVGDRDRRCMDIGTVRRLHSKESVVRSYSNWVGGICIALLMIFVGCTSSGSGRLAGGSATTALGGGNGSTLATTGSATTAPGTGERCKAQPLPGNKISTAYGFQAGVPSGWTVNIDQTPPASPVPPSAPSTPFLHAGNFDFGQAIGTLGEGGYSAMGPGDVFVAIVALGPVGQIHFPMTSGVPCGLTAEAFDTRNLPQLVAGHAGSHQAFSDQGRGFDMLAVVGDVKNADKLVPLIDSFLVGVKILPE